MRVSSNTLFDNNVAVLNQQQARLMQTQLQAATGKKVLTAGSDPVAAARILDVSQLDAANTQQAVNRGSARDTLISSETTLSNVTLLLQDVRTAAVGLGSASANPAARNTVIAELSGRLKELVGYANTKDAAGNYVFSGFQTKLQPFVDTPAGVSYFGDDGKRMVQASSVQQVSSNDSGADVFMRIKNGNGTFDVSSFVPPGSTVTTNTGSGVIGAGSVINPALLTGNNYSIDFSVAAGVTNYTVTNTTTGVAMPAQPYVSGQAISFDGMQLSISGAPANGDSFTVQPSKNESVFKTISDLITTLQSPATGANMTNAITRGINNIDNALNNIVNVRGTVGLRINQLDALQVAGDDVGVQLKQTLSKLQDVDYNKTLTDLTQQQLSLQAAQKSFVKISELSMFSYM